jgi:hypothetical protein
LLTINLHLYSDVLSTVAVQSTDNFASGSAHGWSYGGSGNGPSFGTGTGTYYDATSGYSLDLETHAFVNSTNQYGNNTAVPFNGIYAYKAYTASNTYTDALIEIFVKSGSGMVRGRGRLWIFKADRLLRILFAEYFQLVSSGSQSKAERSNDGQVSAGFRALW